MLLSSLIGLISTIPYSTCLLTHTYIYICIYIYIYISIYIYFLASIYEASRPSLYQQTIARPRREPAYAVPLKPLSTQCVSAPLVYEPGKICKGEKQKKEKKKIKM